MTFPDGEESPVDICLGRRHHDTRSAAARLLGRSALERCPRARPPPGQGHDSLGCRWLVDDAESSRARK